MKRFAATLMLLLAAGTAPATFEIEDPAARLMEEQEAAEERKKLEKKAICTIDFDTNECSCVSETTGKPLDLEFDRCLVIAMEQRKAGNP